MASISKIYNELCDRAHELNIQCIVNEKGRQPRAKLYITCTSTTFVSGRISGDVFIVSRCKKYHLIMYSNKYTEQVMYGEKGDLLARY